MKIRRELISEIARLIDQDKPKEASSLIGHIRLLQAVLDPKAPRVKVYSGGKANYFKYLLDLKNKA